MQTPSDSDAKQTLFDPGTILADRYEIVRSLGSGAMGAVYLARDKSLDQELTAIKILFPHLVQDRSIFARFRNEVLLARRLSHPNIVRTYDFGNAGNGYYYISMEYISGTSLKERIYSPKYPQLSFEENIRILYEIGLGISEAHRRGIVHRDIKPDNILISDTGEVKVSDFGLARFMELDKGLTRTGETVGTPCYMSPEQIRGESLKPTSDIYSLGILAYEMVVGAKPFNDDNWVTLATMHMTQALPKIPKGVEVPKWFYGFLERATAKEPEDRFPDALAWNEELMHRSSPRGSSRRPAVLSPAVFSQTLRDAVVDQINRHRYQKKTRTFIKRAFLFSVILGFSAIVPPLLLRNTQTGKAISAQLVSGIERLAGTSFPISRRALALPTQSTTETINQAVIGNDPSLSIQLVLFNGNSEDLLQPLETALTAKSIEAVSSLIQHGAPTQKVFPSELFPIDIATEIDSAEILQLILNNGASAQTQSLGLTPLHRAAKNGSLNVIDPLLAAGAFLNAVSREGKTPLHIAAEKQNIPMVQVLLEKGAKVDSRDSTGRTALHTAAEEGNLELAQVLIHAGADTGVLDLKAKTPLDLAPLKLRRLLTQENVSAGSKNTSNLNASLQDQSATSEKLTSLTTLRVVGGVDSRIRNDGVPKIEFIKVKIRNVGSVQAQAIALQAVLPNGKFVLLEGENSLEPNKEALFSANVPEKDAILTQRGEIKIKLNCSNCRKNSS
jgi:serine/threonine protein kinase